MAIAAVGQLCSTASMAHNLRQCQTLVSKAIAAGAKALFLPEASDYISSSADESVALAKSVTESEFVLGLQKEARDARLAINVGVHEPTVDGKKVKNTVLWIDERGEIVQRYQKLHLFDVEIAGGPVLRESKYAAMPPKIARKDDLTSCRSVEEGKKILPPFETAVGRVGLMICFDLRFPEISLALKRQGSQVLTYPSAFTIPTGKAHWQPLLTARAIETQAYVVAAAQSGQHNEKRVSYGHSMIISPWGEVLAQLGGGDVEPEIITAEIDLEHCNKVKREMPLRRRT